MTHAFVERLPDGLQDRYETFASEGLKNYAVDTLHVLGSTVVGREVLARYATGGEPRIESEALHTIVGGIAFENPVLIGPGWDKEGVAMKGLYALGFAGGTVGTVPLLGQPGNDKPRMWTIDEAHSVGINRLGFNSSGAEVVDANLTKQGQVTFPVGINIGINKFMLELHPDMVPQLHADVIRKLYKHAAYYELGVSSPNTPGVRGLQNKKELEEIVIACEEAMDDAHGGTKERFIKIAEMPYDQLDDVLEIAERYGWGVAAINTATTAQIKAKYGSRWENEMGGLSGDDPDYRKAADDITKYIYEKSGDRIPIIGVGAVKDAESALRRMRLGASAVQIVTAMRPTWGRVAAQTNRGILQQMTRDGVHNVTEYIGSDTQRGPLTA